MEVNEFIGNKAFSICRGELDAKGFFRNMYILICESNEKSLISQQSLKSEGFPHHLDI